MIISWSQFCTDIKILAAEIPTDTYEGFLAIRRGGIVPAAMLAYHMDVNYIHIPIIDKKGNSLAVPEKVFADYRNWLIVDDIVDSGQTVNMAKQFYRNTKIATVYARDKTKHLVNYYAHMIPHDEWLTFPWETEYEEEVRRQFSRQA